MMRNILAGATLALLASGAFAADPIAPDPIPMVIPTPSYTIINPVTTTVGIGATFDGSNRRIGVRNTAASCDAEGQIPVFVLENGATLQNVIIHGGVPGSDGVHCKGSCTIRNVYWEDVCASAATAAGNNGVTATIRRVIALKATNEAFRQTGKNSQTLIEYAYVNEAGKLWRSCGDCTANGGPRRVSVNTVRLAAVKEVVAVNANYADVATLRNIQIKGYTPGTPKVCVEYRGVVKGSGIPAKLGERWNTASCNVAPTDVRAY